MEMTLMGTGTSHGVPVIGCNCKVCTSSDEKNKRFRCSAYIKSNEAKLVIDTGPEFRLQCIKYKIQTLDAVLLTHSHADHMNGLDDVRIFSHTKSSDAHKKSNETKGEGLDLYANKNTLHDLKNRFDYIFKDVQIGGGKPKLCLHEIPVDNKNQFVIKDIYITPVNLKHGKLNDCGYIFTDACADKGIAYLTDCNHISSDSFSIIKNSCTTIEHLVIDALRIKPHSTHFSFLEAMDAAQKIKAKHTWFIHMTHEMLHTEVQEYIDENLKLFPVLEKIVKEEGGSVSPAYDGLILKV